MKESSLSAWRKILYASYSRQQWDEQDTLEVGGCLPGTCDVLDSFNYLQHSFNVLGLVGAQTSPGLLSSQVYIWKRTRPLLKNSETEQPFFGRWLLVILKGIYMHSTQRGNMRNKNSGWARPSNKYSCIERNRTEQKKNTAIKNIHPSIFHACTKARLCRVHSGCFRGLWRMCLASRNELDSHQTCPSDFRVGPTSRGRTVHCRLIWHPTSSSELLIFFAALGGGAHLKGGLVTGGAAPARKGWCISFRYSPLRFWF